MATEISMNATALGVENEQTAPRFEVEVDGARLGQLRVSRGGVRWLPTGHQDDAHHLTWPQFDRLMRDQVRR
jgi:hypothetical protein